jgi:hypothetical protein
MFRNSAMALTLLAGFGGSAAAADFDADAHHAKLMDAFNNRQWEEVKSLLADDSVFHRANATEVYSGPDAIVDHFEQPIGGSGTSSLRDWTRPTSSPATTVGWSNAATSPSPQAPMTAPAMQAPT